MTDTVLKKINPIQPDSSADGLILDVNTGDLGNADTSYTYIPFGMSNFNLLSLHYTITATTLTIEGSNDNPQECESTSGELITATNDRTFAGAGNWASDGSGASVAVGAGVLGVTVGSANTGAKLDKAYFNSARGFRSHKKYTVTFTISGLSAGTVSLYYGNELVVSGLTDGAAQTATFFTKKAGDKLSFIGTNAAATFNLDNISVTDAAQWRDITDVVTDGAATSFTASGSLTIKEPIAWQRLRIKRLTTNATNALEIRLARSRI